MNKISRLLFNCSILAAVPFSLNAAGTYYTGNYQSPQNNYGNRSYSQTGYYNQRNGYTNNPYASASRMQSNQQNTQQNLQQNVQPQKNTRTSSDKSGFYLNGGISREVAMWNFEMVEAGSILHYDNVSWNVFDFTGGYVFNAGKTPLVIDGGLKIGMQSGESTMVDDDITNGGYVVTSWVDGAGDEIGTEMGHALSVGSSSGGSMMGFNIGFGLQDFWTVGKTKITPSVGYRHFSYKLETTANYGLSVDTTACFVLDSGETQCDPAIIYSYTDGTQAILWRDDITDELLVDTTASYIDTGSTYYFEQPGTSHSYEVAWSGPYIALDMVYDINQYNSVDGRIELGMPGYKSTGDQPYRFDWQNPKSVEDSAGMGSAFHFGMGANWNTAVTDRVALSIGLTYDYYSVSGANAKTYLNEAYYQEIYDFLLSEWETAGHTEAEMLDEETGDPIALNIKGIEESCPGWVCNQDGEIESFYKSMGIRVGLNAKF